MKYSAKMRMTGWVGDPFRQPLRGGAETVQPQLYADADFTGCVDTLRSTSGVHLCLQGPHTSFPLAGLSKGQ
eukprot:782648-Alexandrium_andersonii.AAC.1